MEPHLYVDITASHPEVTGSCISFVCKFPTGYNEYRTVHGLVDCGLFQETDHLKDNLDFSFNPKKLDFVLVTHNHADHIGRLPLLVKKGFRGPIYINKVHRKYIHTAFEDTVKIMEAEQELNGTPALYSEKDVEQTMSQLVAIDYNTVFEVYNPGTGDRITITFFQNGHILGASMIFVRVHPSVFPKWMNSDKDVNLLFTGDYKETNTFAKVSDLPDEILQKRFTIIQESTYGYMDSSEIRHTFEKHIVDAISEGKFVVNFAYAQERAQQILLAIRKMQDEGKIPCNIPVYLDGNLAYKYTDKYMDMMKKGCANLSFLVKPEEFLPYSCSRVYDSRDEVISNASQPGILITTSGDGSHGPGNYYIMNLVENPNVVLQFTGYTTVNSLGTKLKKSKSGSTIVINGQKKVRKAKVCSTNEFSVHAKADELIDFLKQFGNIAYVLVNHGNYGVKEQYAERVENELKLTNKVGVLDPFKVYRVYCKGLEKTFSA